MQDLIGKFDSALCSMGNPLLTQPLFYNSPIGIRFQIGYGDIDVHENYFTNAVDRLVQIYKHNSFTPDMLRINVVEDDCFVSKQSVLDVCRAIGLGEFVERIDKLDIDGETITEYQLYWNIGETDFDYIKLFFEIVRGDFGGNRGFVSSVYFLDSENHIMFHPYDDRGADLIAADREKIRCFYNDFNAWILDYDREKINKLFLS